MHFGEDAAKRPVFGEAASSKQIARKRASKRLLLSHEILDAHNLFGVPWFALFGGGGGGPLIRGAGARKCANTKFFGKIWPFEAFLQG